MSGWLRNVYQTVVKRLQGILEWLQTVVEQLRRIIGVLLIYNEQRR